MAKLTTTTKIRKINDRLHDLCDGKLNKPIKLANAGEFTGLVHNIEKLRVILLTQASHNAEADQATQQMIASVTHDLKTPLAVIAGYAESMQDGMDDKDYPKLIQEKAFEMNEMVLRIIESARESAAEAAKTLKLRDAQEVIKNSITKHMACATEKGILVHLGHIPRVRIAINETEFDSVIENLLSNAAKFTPEGGKIKIFGMAPLNTLYLAVKDTGCGIEAKDLPHIFEKYFSVDKARSGKNTGIGLHSVKQIMKAHGGDVFCQSKPGKGSKFTIYLPRYAVEGAFLTDTERNALLAFLALIFFPFLVVIDFFNFIDLVFKVMREDKYRNSQERAENREMAKRMRQQKKQAREIKRGIRKAKREQAKAEQNANSENL